jgi:hypothetical protein
LKPCKLNPPYGLQEGAKISYNPKKPRRPSHVLHTDWIGSLRLVVDTEVQKGKAHAGKHGMPRLLTILERLSPEQRPVLVRGGSAFGNEDVMAALEGMEPACPFKLLRSAGAKRLIERQWSRHDWQVIRQDFDTVEAFLPSPATGHLFLRQPTRVPAFVRFFKPHFPYLL